MKKIQSWVQTGWERISANPETFKLSFSKIRGLFCLIVGYLLSPVCWWNDLVFNLPVAYGFGYLCNLVWPDSLMPGTIVGYWFSNIIGILMMQFGVVDILPKSSENRNLKKDLITGLISSTAYTVVIIALVQFNILDTPILAALQGEVAANP
ncbi:hypothetical protein Oscil6304_3466 [Oscillatoria acuminata PCC 6304]|uniref:Uncharacterized protein n=1 Tax=Oscillatoria acuminata PCC 6304 TaxID=56110 RepID=K9TLZ2_9CYAN|nr:hypothetical protein Oscil6304_3466 [Oscillatoria acuminata PCC 6304]